jgi:hypothetical protein
MTIRFYVYNEFENGVLSASSENATFPLSNLKDDRRTKVYRSITNSDSMVLDMGSIKPIDSFCMVSHTFSGFNLSSLTLELNNVNTWTSPPVSIPITIDYVNGIALYEFNATVNYRYARLVLSSTSGFCELSKCFLGLRSVYADVDFSYPLNFQVNNLSTVVKNRYGQRFIDEIGTQRIIKAKIDYVPRESIDSFMDWLNLVSNTKPFFINFDNGQLAVDVNRFNGFYYLSTEPTLNLTSGNFWSLDLTLEEAN